MKAQLAGLSILVLVLVAGAVIVRTATHNDANETSTRGIKRADAETRKCGIETKSTTPTVLTSDSKAPSQGGISGTVVDVDGRTVEGAIVMARAWNILEELETASDTNGVFEFREVNSKGIWSVAASKDSRTSRRRIGIRPKDESTRHIRLTLEPSASIAGKVVDEHGVPVGGAYVAPVGSVVRDIVVQCDSAGAFEIPNLAAGRYRVRGARILAGLPSAKTTEPFELAAGEARTGVVVVDAQIGRLSISGRVLDPWGKPAVAAQVQAYAAQESYFSRTDASGAYAVYGLDRKKYSVAAHHQDYGSAVRDEVAAGTANVDLKLSGKAAIQGQVVNDATGKPVTDFEYALFRENTAPRDVRIMSGLRTVHDDRGAFRGEAGIGKLTLLVRARGFLPAFVPVGSLEPGQMLSGLEARLKEGRIVEGQVLNSSGEPVDGADLFAGDGVPSESLRPGKFLARSDAEGRFRIGGLNTDDTTVTANATHYLPVAVALPKTLGVPLTIVLGEGCVVEGRVTLAGKAVAAKVDVTNLTGRRTTVSTATLADGTYRLAGLPAGDTSVTARADQREHRLRVMVMPGTVARADFDFPAEDAVLEGRVTRLGEPVPAHLSALVDGGDGSLEHYSTSTEPDGRYRFENLAPGNVMLAATLQFHRPSAEESEPSRVYSTQTVAGSTTRFDIDFSGGATLRVTVGGIEPNDGCFLQVYVGGPPPVDAPPMDGHRCVARTQTREPDGTFLLEDLQAGSYTLHATASAWPTQGVDSGESTRRSGDVSFSVREGETIHVMVDLQR